MRILGVYNIKGGVGKTAAAIRLAERLTSLAHAQETIDAWRIRYNDAEAPATAEAGGAPEPARTGRAPTPKPGVAASVLRDSGTFQIDWPKSRLPD